MKEKTNNSQKKKMFNLVKLIDKSSQNGKTIKQACIDYGISTSTYYRWKERYVYYKTILELQRSEKLKTTEKKYQYTISDSDVKETHEKISRIIDLALKNGKTEKFLDHEQISLILNLEHEIFEKFNNEEIPKLFILIEHDFIKLFKDPYYLDNLERLCRYEDKPEYLWKLEKDTIVGVMYKILISFHRSLLEQDLEKAKYTIGKLRHLFIQFNRDSMGEPSVYFNFADDSDIKESTNNLKIVWKELNKISVSN